MKSLSVKHSFILIVLMALSSTLFSQRKDSTIFDNSTLKISEISSNSIHSDFGPAIVRDTLFFTTFNDKLLRMSDDILKKKEFYDLYKAALDKQGDIIGKREPVEEFITRFNDGPVSWCQKTGELFITQNYIDQSVKPKPFQNEVNRLRIIVAKWINGKWKTVYSFPYNNLKYSVGHPAVTESGDTLVFSSDKPGGYGETDLYYSIRKNDKWDTPVNLGPKINTDQKEEFAFITDKSFGGFYLIFSSKRKGGNGGFDLYYTRFPSDYSEIGHFESPVNTISDDFAMTIPSGADYGYLTSNRPGTGDDDIYKFTFKRNSAPPKPKFREVYVFDKSSLHPIPGAEVILCDKKSYKTDEAGKIESLSCLETDCEANASAFGYPGKSKILVACNKNSQELTRDTIWMNIIVNEKIALRNIYYDFDKWNILPDAAQELDRLVSLMKENPAMKVELGSHTDDRGTEPYNLKLSQLRAQSAVDYIVSKGIDKSRIKGTGYGKTQLIHKGVDGKKCTPTQNRENRRTEIFIPGFLRAEQVKQEKGDYSNGKPDATKDYSSKKEHGSIFDQTQEAVKAPQVDKAPTVVPAKKIIKAAAAVIPPKAKPEPKEINTPKVEAVPPVAIPVNPAGGDEVKYYLVLGSFKEKTTALKFALQLKSEGYEATTYGESEPVRVGIGFARFSQAKEQLEVLKDKYKGAWILKK